MKEELKNTIKKVTNIVISQNLNYKTVVKNLQNHMSKGLATDIAGIACKRAEYFNNNKGKCVNLNYILD